MKVLSSFLVLALLAFTACTTITTTQVTNIKKITQGVVQTASIAALAAKPAESRVYLTTVLQSLDATIATKTVTATQLGKVVEGLNLDPNIVRWAGGAFLVYDTLSLFWSNAASEAALLAGAEGMASGIRWALTAIPPAAAPTAPAVASARAMRGQWAPVSPEPTPSNTRRL